jgi:hypothetical protein
MTADQGASTPTVRNLVLVAPDVPAPNLVEVAPRAAARMSPRMNFVPAASRSHRPHRLAGHPHPKAGQRTVLVAAVAETDRAGASWSPPTHVRQRGPAEVATVDPRFVDIDDHTLEFELVPADVVSAEVLPAELAPADVVTADVEPDEHEVAADLPAVAYDDAPTDNDSGLSIFTFEGTVDDPGRAPKTRGRLTNPIRRRLFSHH